MGVLSFAPQPNTDTGSKVRSCEVTVSPKDNPDYVITTFQVFQATNSYSVQLEEGGPFTFDPKTKTLSAPAEGGEATLWLTFSSALSVSVPETADWLQAEMTEEDGFWRMKVQVAAAEGAGREATLSVTLQTGAVTIGEIKVIQAGESAGN